MSTKGIIFDIDRFSTHDGPGIRTAIFLKGCPLSCRWCHSPESQYAGDELLYRRARCTGCGVCVAECPGRAITHDGEIIDNAAGVTVHREKCVRCYSCAKACQSGALRKCGQEYSAEELIFSIKPDLPFFMNSGGGVTVTGGEALCQPDFTFGLLSGFRDLGIDTLLETSGYGSCDELLRISEVCSHIFFDIKVLDDEAHRQWTGVSGEIIHKNLFCLCGHKNIRDRITVRVPCIPDVNDGIDYIRKISLFVKETGIRNIELLPYNIMAGEKYRWIGRSYLLGKTEARDKAYYEELNRELDAAGLNAVRS